MAYDYARLDAKLQDARDWLAREYGGIRTGRATPAILDGIAVTAYGALTPIKQTANISVEDARTLRVTPWDHSLIKEIERAVAAANLGVGTVADSAGLRVTFPELTSERRAQLIKVAKQKLEDARATVRVIRDDARKEVQEQEKEGGMSEDEKFRILDEVQKRVDAANGALEQAFEKKEHEMQA
jgi:ribosome recycling factor